MSQLYVESTNPPAAAESAVRLEGVLRARGGRRVLDGLSLAVAERSRVGIVGRSGVGKSTLLSLVAGLDEPDAGVVDVSGATTAKRRIAACALMPQRDCLLPWRTALDNSTLALENAGISKTRARALASPFFERFGLAGCELQRPAQLSGGMRQRVAFLRTLLSGKPVLLLDEPFGALDVITRAELQVWLAEALAAEPRTVLLVTHDVEEALLLCERVLVLREGRITLDLQVDVGAGLSRSEAVTHPGFLSLRERALEAIG